MTVKGCKRIRYKMVMKQLALQLSIIRNTPPLHALLQSGWEGVKISKVYNFPSLYDKDFYYPLLAKQKFLFKRFTLQNDHFLKKEILRGLKILFQLISN